MIYKPKLQRRSEQHQIPREITSREITSLSLYTPTSDTSPVDPQPLPPPCFLDRDHVAKLTEHAKTKEKQGADDRVADPLKDPAAQEDAQANAAHKPKRILRTVIASIKNSKEFGQQMKREATRRRFDQAQRKAFVADGLTCNWTIHAEHFSDYVPILDFIHAVSYLFTASVVLFGKTDQALAGVCPMDDTRLAGTHRRGAWRTSSASDTHRSSR